MQPKDPEKVRTLPITMPIRNAEKLLEITAKAVTIRRNFLATRLNHFV